MTQARPAAVAIETVGLTKQFGPITALRGVDLQVASGESVALFGPNGAGKTTLIRILTLTQRSSGGSFRIGGLDPRTEDLAIRQRVGVVSHQSFLYDDLSALQNLEFFARLYGVADATRRATELLETVGMAHRAEDPVGTLSRGLQQRVSLVRALIHDPPIVFLDEPFTGLDPHAARMFRSTLEHLREQGRTVLLVTHNLLQGLELSDRWIILSAGRIIDQGSSTGSDHARFERLYLETLSRPRSRVHRQ